MGSEWGGQVFSSHTDKRLSCFPDNCDLEMLKHPAVHGIAWYPDGKCKYPKIIVLFDDKICAQATAEIQYIFDKYHSVHPLSNSGGMGYEL